MKKVIAGLCCTLLLAFLTGCGNSEAKKKQEQFDLIKAEMNKTVDEMVTVVTGPDFRKAGDELNAAVATAKSAETAYLQAHKDGKTADMETQAKAYAEAVKTSSKQAMKMMQLVRPHEQKINQIAMVTMKLFPDDETKTKELVAIIEGKMKAHENAVTPLREAVLVVATVEIELQKDLRSRLKPGDKLTEEMFHEAYNKAAAKVLADKANPPKEDAGKNKANDQK